MEGRSRGATVDSDYQFPSIRGRRFPSRGVYTPATRPQHAFDMMKANEEKGGRLAFQRNPVSEPSSAVAVLLAASILGTQAFFPHRVEANFWEDRARVAQRVRSPQSADPTSSLAGPLLASLPSTPGFPPSPFPSASFAARTGVSAAEIPIGVAEEMSEKSALIAALLPHAVIRHFVSGGPRAPLVIHLQDIHGHRGAQRHIAQILRTVLEAAPRSVTLVEGAAGPLRLEPWRAGSTEEIRRAAAFFFNTEMIGGAEFAALTAPREAVFVGAENPDLYIKNVAAVRDAARVAPGLRTRLAAGRRRLDQWKIDGFSKDLKELDARGKKWASGDEPLGSKIEFLHAQARAFGLEIGPEIRRYREAASQEKNLDLESANRERGELLETLTRRVSATVAQTLCADALAFRAGRLRIGVYYDRLQKLLRAQGLPLNARPAFSAYVRYVIAVDAINPATLQSETDALETRVWDRTCRAAAERRLVETERNFQLLEGLADLRLSPDQWRRWSVGPKQAAFDALFEPGDPPLAEALKPFESFYASAEARNGALSQAVLEASKSPAAVTVLVAGGFHSDGLAPLLRAGGVSVLTLTPKLDEAGETPGALDLFTRDRTPLESLFAAPRIALSKPLALQPIGPSAAADTLRALFPAVGRAAVAVDRSPDGVARESVEGGRVMVVAEAPDRFPTADEKKGWAGRADCVLADVPVSIEEGEKKEGPRLSVYRRRLSRAGRFWRWGAARAFKGVSFLRARAAGPSAAMVWKGAALATVAVGLILFPGTAHAYDFVQNGMDYIFTPVPGEHLWGAAKEILRRTGVEHATGQQIWEVIGRIVDANGSAIADPNRIFAGHSYAVPGDLIPAGPAAPAAVVAPAPLPGAGALPGPVVSPGNSGEWADVLWVLFGKVGASFSLTPAVALGMGGLAYWWARRSDRGFRVGGATRDSKKISRRFSFALAIVETLKTPWLAYGAGAWLAVTLFPGFGPVAWLTAQLGLAGFDTFLKILSVVIVFFVFRFIFALRRQATASPPAPGDPALAAWRTQLDRSDRWTLAETNSAVDFARTVLRNHRFLGPGTDPAKNAAAYHALSRQAQETADRLYALLEARPDMKEDSRRELVAKARWFERTALYAVRARKLTVGSVINVEHIRSKYGGTGAFREILWDYVRSPLSAVRALFRDPAAGPRLQSSLKELAARYVARPLFGMNKRLSIEERKFSVRAKEVMALGNDLQPDLYPDVASRVEEWRRRLFVDDIDEKEKPGLPGVWDGRNLLSPVLALGFFSVYALYVLQHGTVGLPIVIAAALIGSLGVMASLHRFFIAKGFWDPAYHTESQALRELGARLDGSWGPDWRKDAAGFERLAFENELEKSRKAWASELSAGDPAVDALVLVARDEAQELFYRAWEHAVRRGDGWRADTPIVIVRQSGAGSGDALAEASAAVRAQWKDLETQFPRLRDRSPDARRIVSLHSEDSGADPFARALGESVHPASGEPFRVFDLQIANAVKASQDLRKGGRGGHIFFNLDRPFVGPIEGTTGIHLLSAWKTGREVAEQDWGILVGDAAGRVRRIVGEAGYDQAGKHVRESDPVNRYAGGTDRVQAFSGSGVVSFGEGLTAADFARLMDDVLESRAGAGEASPVDLLDDVVIPLSLGPKKLYSYLAARGDLSVRSPPARRAFFQGLFNHFERTLSGRSGDAPVLRFETHTAPEGSSNFIQSARQDWSDFYPPHRLEDPDGLKTSGEWMERWAADGGAWRQWMFRSSPAVASLIAGAAVAMRGLAGVSLSPVEIQLYPLVAKVAEWKAGVATAVSLSLVSLNLWAMGDRRTEHAGAALLATVFDFGTMLLLGVSGLGLVSLASWAGRAGASASNKNLFPWGRALGGALLLLGLWWGGRAMASAEGPVPRAFPAKTAPMEFTAPDSLAIALPVIGAPILPFRRGRSRVATFPGQRSRSVREVTAEAGTRAGEGVVRLREESEKWLPENRAVGFFYRTLSDWVEAAGVGSSAGPHRKTEAAGPFRDATSNPITARALRSLAWQTVQALRTRDLGVRPTAEALRMAFFWGLAGGAPSELSRVLDPVVSPRLRGTLPKPIFHSWMNGQSSRANSHGPSPAAWRILQTAVPGVPGKSASPTAPVDSRVRWEKGFRGTAVAFSRLFAHPATPALLTLVTLPVLFGANLLGLLAAFQLVGWSAPSLAAVLSFIVAVAGSLAEHKLLSDLRNDFENKKSPAGAALEPSAVPIVRDVTLEVANERAASAEALAILVDDARRRGDVVAERELARLVAAQLAVDPMRNDLLDGFDALKTRRWMREALRERGNERRPGRRPSADYLLNEMLRIPWGHQLAQIGRSGAAGLRPTSELRQAAYLAGLSGADRSAAERVLAGAARIAGVDLPADWTQAWEHGRALAGHWFGAPGVPESEAAPALITALRVTELMNGAGSPPSLREAVTAQLVERARRDVRRPDILIVNGSWMSGDRRGWTEDRVKRELRKELRDRDGQLDPAVAAYLKKSRVLLVAADAFSPDAVLRFDAGPAHRRGKTLNLLTADLDAVLFDPRREDAPFRVLLLQCLSGRLTVLDVGEWARRALKTARVVVTSA